MLNRHMCSGRPVVADCMRTNWSGVCVPSPSGSSASVYRSAAFLIICSRSAMGISRSTSRARWAWRMSRSTRPPLARLTSASGFAGGEVDDLVDCRGSCRVRPSAGRGCGSWWVSLRVVRLAVQLREPSGSATRCRLGGVRLRRRAVEQCFVERLRIVDRANSIRRRGLGNGYVPPASHQLPDVQSASPRRIVGEVPAPLSIPSATQPVQGPRYVATVTCRYGSSRQDPMTTRIIDIDRLRRQSSHGLPSEIDVDARSPGGCRHSACQQRVTVPVLRRPWCNCR